MEEKEIDLVAKELSVNSVLPVEKADLEQLSLSKDKKGLLVVEMNAGQMVQDVRLAVDGSLPVAHFGRQGGVVPEPEELVKALKEKLQ